MPRKARDDERLTRHRGRALEGSGRKRRGGDGDGHRRVGREPRDLERVPASARDRSGLPPDPLERDTVGNPGDVPPLRGRGRAAPAPQRSQDHGTNQSEARLPRRCRPLHATRLQRFATSILRQRCHCLSGSGDTPAREEKSRHLISSASEVVEEYSRATGSTASPFPTCCAEVFGHCDRRACWRRLTKQTMKPAFVDQGCMPSGSVAVSRRLQAGSSLLLGVYGVRRQPQALLCAMRSKKLYDRRGQSTRMLEVLSFHLRSSVQAIAFSVGVQVVPGHL